MPDLFKLTGQVALVTGASRGLGLAMAEGLAAQGAHVVLNARSVDALEANVESLRAKGYSASYAAFDAADEPTMVASVAEIAKTHGRLDIAIANAGIQNRTPFLELSTEDIRKVLEINLISVMTLAREAARPMVANKHGRLIFTGSIMGQVGRPTVNPYAAAKAGVMGVIKTLAAELGPHGINVNAIAPGFFATEMNTALTENADFNAFVSSRTALGRWAQPEEIAGAAVFLASNASSYLTGQTLTVDGGLMAMA
ncbi:SDR family oxidoreductase [Acuticoccus sp. M5D2P5]|uniref:SDR family oxidoreductase n=1 Tax=Acuticoccus kalidii TaxID=2910977 RepID=UPI001F2D4B21|nr:SDR family oxidoreductase [Acuticoccus kalidii]MCF3935223.1 SDR family oxidoreductase [Acuticoccus kalidii]